MPVLTDSYFTDRIREEEKDDSSIALPTKEAIEEYTISYVSKRSSSHG